MSFRIEKDKLLVVAELGLSHLGSYGRCIEMIDAAKESGADAVKFQIYDPREIWTDLDDIARRLPLQLQLSKYENAIMYAKSLGLVVGASFFGPHGKDLQHQVDFIKIASRSYPDKMPEIVADKQLVISCGRFLPADPASDVCYLACKSDYPAKSFPLDQMVYLSEVAGLWGFSCHAPHYGDCARAVELVHGCSMIEKHFCLDRSTIEIDREHSLEPEEFRKMVTDARSAHESRK